MKKTQLNFLVKYIVKEAIENENPSPNEKNERWNDKELFQLFKKINPQSGIYGETPFDDNLRNFSYIIMTKFGKNSGDAVYVITKYWNQSEEVAIKIVDDVMKYIAKQKYTGPKIPRNENAFNPIPGSALSDDKRLYMLGRKLDEIDEQGRKYSRFSQERVALEDERSKVWVEFRTLFNKIKGIKAEIVKEDHGLGFSHNFSVPIDKNTMDMSTIKEQGSSEDRKRKLITSHPNKAVKMLFDWVKSNQIEYVEFEDLLADIVSLISKHIS